MGTVIFPKNKFAFHVTKWKKVPRGTNGSFDLIRFIQKNFVVFNDQSNFLGGISFMGTLASIIGGLCVGLAYYATLKTSLFFTFSSKSNSFIGYNLYLFLIYNP